MLIEADKLLKNILFYIKCEARRSTLKKKKVSNVVSQQFQDIWLFYENIP